MVRTPYFGTSVLRYFGTSVLRYFGTENVKWTAVTVAVAVTVTVTVTSEATDLQGVTASRAWLAVTP